jgi:predicted homoserine dehydrogenase-like protein
MPQSLMNIYRWVKSIGYRPVLMGNLRRDISKDCAITCADVELPNNRLIHKLRAEQDAYFQNGKAH